MKKMFIFALLITLIFSAIAYGVDEDIDGVEYPADLESDSPEEIPYEDATFGEEVVRDEAYYRAKVLEVMDLESDDVHFDLEQRAEVIITSGPYRGEVFTIESPYEEDHYYFNIYLEKGMNVILMGEEEDGELESVFLHDIARDRGVFYLLVIFVALLLLIGGWQGFKTILTLLFAGIVIINVMLPLLLAGYQPIPVSVISAIIIIIPMLLIIGGVNAKSVSAIIGTFVGVFVAGTIALIVGRVVALTGLSSEGAQILAVMEHKIDLQGLLFAGIIIGSLGAVTDVSMSIASSISEIKENNPNIEILDLMSSGMNVGRDIMGTMANTLLLAYVGSAIPLLLLLLSADISLLRIINMDVIVTEVVKGLTGSIGLITSIPVTAIVASFIIDWERRRKNS